jgi:hypothetical protein
MHITNEDITGSYLAFRVRFYISELNNEPLWGRFNKADALVLPAVLLFCLHFFLPPWGENISVRFMTLHQR